MNKFTFTLISVFFSSFFTIVVACPDLPANDDPCITMLNPPIDLTGGGTHQGTTCCARGFNDDDGTGNPADLENQSCIDTEANGAVWYTYNTDDDEQGIELSIAHVSGDDSLSIEFYSGLPDGGCTGAISLIGKSCITNVDTFHIGNCLSPNEIIFVKVIGKKEESSCSTFNISMTPGENQYQLNNTCFEADANIGGSIEVPGYAGPFIDNFICFYGNMNYACPVDNPFGGCDEMLTMPTIWYKLEVEDMEGTLFTTVESYGGWTPIWSVYGTDSNCENILVLDQGGSPPCSNNDNTPELQQTALFEEIVSYYLAISMDTASTSIHDLENTKFEVCIATNFSATICLGEYEGDQCNDESLVFEVIERENESGSLNGPFCPGEEVRVKVNFTYEAPNTADDWLMGFVPKFGSGWDVSNFDFTSNVAIGNGLESAWFDESSVQPPTIQINTPILCTYVNDDGSLELCNLLCEECNECDEPLGLQEGDPLPGGYFWLTEGENIGCANDGSLSQGWGIGSKTAEVEWIFDIRVKDFSEMGNCENSEDLSISFQTFSHGSVGCWEDAVSKCVLDRTMFSPAWVIDCDMVGSGMDCDGMTTSIEEETDLKDLDIVPNPVIETATIIGSVKDDISYKILNTAGKVITDGIIVNQSKTLDLSILPSGLYIIEFSTEKTRTSKKLVKM